MRCSPVFMNAQNAAAQLLARKQTTSVSSQWSFDGSFRACATNSSNLESRTLGWETGSTSCSRGQGRQFSLHGGSLQTRWKFCAYAGCLLDWPRTGDEDVHESPRALLPVRTGRHVGNADQCPK